MVSYECLPAIAFGKGLDLGVSYEGRLPSPPSNAPAKRIYSMGLVDMREQAEIDGSQDDTIPKVRGAFIVHHWDESLVRNLESWASVCDELLVVINGRVGSARITLGQLETRDKIAVLHGHGNVGYGTASNLAFVHGRKLSDQDVFLVLNSDARPVDPRRFAQLIRCADFDVGAFRFEDADGSPQRSLAPFPSSRAFFKSIFLGEEGVVGALGIDSYPVGAAVAVRAWLFREMAGFDPDFFMYYEEVDLLRRAADRSARWRFIDAPVVHEGAASTSRHPAALDRELGRSAVIYRRKHPEVGKRWLLTLGVLLLLGGVKHGPHQLRRNTATIHGLLASILTRDLGSNPEWLLDLAVVPASQRAVLGSVK